MPHGHRVENFGLRIRRKGRKFELGGSRSEISDSDFPPESSASFPSIVGVCVCIRSGADGEDGDGDGNCDGDGDGDSGHSTRST